MDGNRAEVDLLLQELEATEREMRPAAESWYLPIGPFSVRFLADPGRIAAIFVTYNVVCLAAGITLIFFHGLPASLGVALVVGTLFALGTFWTQFYAVAFQREEKIRPLTDPEYYENLQRLAIKRKDLVERIKRLLDSDRDSGGHRKQE